MRNTSSGGATRGVTRGVRVARGVNRARWSVALFAAATLSLAAAPFASTDAPIADAEMRGDSAAVRQLIKQGGDVNEAQGDGMTALHWAAMRGDAAQASMLIYAGARLEAATRNGNYTPLHLAARAGKVATVKALLAAGADVKAATTSGGTTALHFAAAEGNADVVNALIDKGAIVDARESVSNQTPLMWAAASDRLAALNALIAHKADLKAISKVVNVPALDSVDRAALGLRTRRAAAIKAAEQPARVPTAPGSLRPRAALDSSAKKDSAAAGVKGAPMKDGKGEKEAKGEKDLKGAKDSSAAAKYPGVKDSSAKHMPGDSAKGAAGAPPATRRGGADSAGGGINRGMSFSDLVGNKGGMTALHYAVREGNTDCVLALLKAGADINQVTSGDHTSPLLMATINGQFDLAKLLLERGANPKLASDAGATPLYITINMQWAAKSLYPQPTAQLRQKTQYLELMTELIDKGADVNARLTKHLWYMSYNFDLLGVNTIGATPFWRAAYGTDVTAMKLLVARGADPTLPTTKPAGRTFNTDGSPEDTTNKKDPSGLAPIPIGGPGVFPIHAASGVGYGEGFAANSHMHAPDGWLPSVKYLIEELHADVNARDFNGYTPLHHAAARGDNELIMYLMSKGADINAVSRKGETVADMANGPVQRIPPFPETVALLEKLGSKNSHKCKSC
jgi:ankyrin repeat protein